MKEFHEIKFNKYYIILNLIVFLLLPICSSSSYSTYTTTIYFKTDGSFNSLKLDYFTQIN